MKNNINITNPFSQALSIHLHLISRIECLKNQVACASSSSSYIPVYYTKVMFISFLHHLQLLVDKESFLDPHNGLRIASISFRPPYMSCSDYDPIAFGIIRLLMKYGYPTCSSFAKFSIVYVIMLPSKQVIEKEEVFYTIGKAVTIIDINGNPVPILDVYAQILKLVMKAAEDYGKEVLLRINIRLYFIDMKNKEVSLSYDEIDPLLWDTLRIANEVEIRNTPEAKAIRNRKRTYHDTLTTVKLTDKERQGFIVADTETLQVGENRVHVPYAAGFLVVNPGDDLSAQALPNSEFITYYSEDALFRFEDFLDRSNNMMFHFIDHLTAVVANTGIKTVYFHNSSRFDGILLMKWFASNKDGEKYVIKPLMRNNCLYELAVYLRAPDETKDNKLLFRIRDSLHIFTSSLKSLGKTLCPELGEKGSLSVAHDDIQVSTLSEPGKRKEFLGYMIQDIRLLGGIMLKGQEIFWTNYHVDITTLLTCSSLAMNIFRSHYYDPNTFLIHIPNRNEDTFIRRGYYGGHADVYIPTGENLYYYDVNSLYPYIMKTHDMPVGKPVWEGDLKDQDLNNLYGFIEAYVDCPKTLKRPFLPFHDDNGTLLFPTGQFVGVYYSEELKFAKKLGYNIYPLRGYLFESKPSPFKGFVTDLYNRRKEAKATGAKAMDYGYKLLMNSLYGRFGINPESTSTEVCSRDRYEQLMQKDTFLYGEKLSDKYYIASYKVNTISISDDEWKPPKISAVHLAAAITAGSRMHMYKYISRDDCFYTDTDSAILGSPLAEELVSSTELGMVKLEYKVKRGYFLAPKSYFLQTEEVGDVMRHKGAARDYVTPEWFQEQYADLSKIQKIINKNPFRVNFHTLEIAEMVSLVKLGAPIGTKRVPIYDKGVWDDTDPKDIIDYRGHDSEVLKIKLESANKSIVSLRKESAQKEQGLASLESELAQLREEMKSLSEAKLPEELTESPTGLEQSTILAEKSEREKGIDGAMILEKERSMPKVEEEYQTEMDMLFQRLMEPRSLSNRELYAHLEYQDRKLDRQSECYKGNRDKETPKPQEEGIEDQQQEEGIEDQQKEEQTTLRSTGETKPTRRTKKLHKKPKPKANDTS